ncbi:MAG: Fic/DOC family N-terminal domain-containing protein [Myxococcota bacterium]|nr:Fic/DOC family N-terminal domain-containing protein [Myxococcota bacterium]
MKRKTGESEHSTVAGEEVRAFIPYPLPPRDPPLDLDGELAPLLARAEEQVQLLDLAGDLVPSIEWFVYAFVRKEAVLSAQIEGTQATLMDLLEVEASGEDPTDADVAEVCGYVSALNYAWEELTRETGLPISMRILSETHRRLLSGARGSQKQPGEVRRSQNWIGGTRPGNATFVPPPPLRLNKLLSEFERAIHDESDLPPLVRVGLLHVQFETLHPYLDGNGRLGRLLITLLLRHWKLLSRPLLYLSLFLKTHQQEYYRRLGAVRTEGDWEGWLSYFLEGVAVVAEAAVVTARRLHAIVAQSRARLMAREDATVMSIRLCDRLPEHPLLTVNRVVDLLACSRPAAAKALGVLEAAEVLHALDDRKKNRTVMFKAYLDNLREGTEL